MDKKVKVIEILPKSNARYFEIQYTYQINILDDQKEGNKNKALAIDLGISNLATCITSEGRSFIVDGKRLKSINRWYNKRNARLQSIKDKQGLTGYYTNNQAKLLRNRNNQVDDYMGKTTRYIIHYCLKNEIGKLVLGYNPGIQKKSNLGKRTNQQFVQIPIGKIKSKLTDLCDLYGIQFVEQEESYTSKSSFFDQDVLPTFHAEKQIAVQFSGKRIKRGMYRTSTGYQFNADVNGALNILKKSNVVSWKGLCARGEMDTPVRIRVA